MNKPKTLHDLLIGQHIGMSEVNTIARTLFNDATTMAGPEGYIVTGVNFDDLPEHVQGFIRKAIFSFTVENVLDADHSNADSVLADEDPDEDPDEDDEE